MKGTRRDKIKNERIRQEFGCKRTLADRIQMLLLELFGPVFKMMNERVCVYEQKELWSVNEERCVI